MEVRTPFVHESVLFDIDFLSRRHGYCKRRRKRLWQHLTTLQTVSTLSAFVLAMVLNPRVLKKAQEEMDYVVNQDRLPDFSDRNSLPYLECIIKEVYRYALSSEYASLFAEMCYPQMACCRSTR